jgi:hypothetical protein
MRTNTSYESSARSWSVCRYRRSAGSPILRCVGRSGNLRNICSRGAGTCQNAAEIGIGDSGKTFVVGKGLGPRCYEISPWWGTNTLDFKVRSGPSFYPLPTGTYFGRDHGKLRLSADGNTLTETALAFLPGMPSSVTCNISGTFHRQVKK